MSMSPLSRFSMFKREPSEASSEHSLPGAPKEEQMDVDEAASDATNETPSQPDFMDSYTRRGERTFDGADSWDESPSPLSFADELDSTQDFAELTPLRQYQDLDGDDMIPEDIDDEGDVTLREHSDNMMSPIPEYIDDEGDLTVREHSDNGIPKEEDDDEENLNMSEDVSVISPAKTSKPDVKVEKAKPIAKSVEKTNVKTITKSAKKAKAKPRSSKKIHTSPPLSKFKANPGSPRCLLCPERPKTMNAFVDHVRAHKSTLKENGIYLLCSCSFKAYYRKAMAKHNKRCYGTSFTIQEREDETETPECIACPDHPRTLGGYIEHLRDYHDTTLKQNRIFLQCSCGFKAYYRGSLKRHSKTCKGTDFTIHEREVEQNPVVLITPKCVMCDSRRKSISAYVHHIHGHKSTLKENGIYLLCSCGFKVTYRGGLRFHDEECDGTEFTVHRRDETEANAVVHKTPKCVMCHRHPKSLGDYVDHITHVHKSTLNTNGIYLICSCDYEVRQGKSMARHSKQCDGRQFTVRQKKKVVQKKVKVAPTCGICGDCPASALDFAYHLQYDHTSSLTEQGIYLACACGYEYRPGVRFSGHDDKCDGRDYTVHKLEEK